MGEEFSISWRKLEEEGFELVGEIWFHPVWVDAEGRINVGMGKVSVSDCRDYLKFVRSSDKLAKPDRYHCVRSVTTGYVRVG